MTVRRYASFESKVVRARTVDVWLPPHYDGSRRLPVLYMHDGQNLFEGNRSISGASWEVDQAILRLIAQGKLDGVIVVGIWNHGEIRWQEYMPQKPYHEPTMQNHHSVYLQRASREPSSDEYLRFMVEELKPFIDKEYQTLPDPANTFVMGSSMGGLISLYAISEYPHIFGGAGCVSTHWTAGGSELVQEMGKRLPTPHAHKLYFDFGTQGLDAAYEPLQTEMDLWLAKAGYTQNTNWLTLKFEGADHNETAWQRRVEIPLSFLLAE